MKIQVLILEFIMIFIGLFYISTAFAFEYDKGLHTVDDSRACKYPVLQALYCENGHVYHFRKWATVNL